LDQPALAFLRAPDGTKLRYGVWNPAKKPCGVCAIFDGQTEFLEKYCEVADELCRRGFAVAVLDWRGQGGSDRNLPDARKAHVRDFSEYDQDSGAFFDQVVMRLGDKPPLALAHSMGAHILLRTLHDKPNAYAGAVLTGPMIEADSRGYPGWLARLVCRTHSFIGLSADWVWGIRIRDPLTVKFEDNLVTSDRTRFARTKNLLAGNPQIRLSGPTWGWLEAAYRSMRRLKAPGYAETITTPLLIVGAGRDRIVNTSATRAFAQRLPNASYVEIEDAEHEILMENDSIRSRFWEAFDEFASRIDLGTR
jgi:lysophospholipase